MAIANGEEWTVDRGGLLGPITYTWDGARWLAPGATASAGAAGYVFRASDAVWLPAPKGALKGRARR